MWWVYTQCEVDAADSASALGCQSPWQASSLVWGVVSSTSCTLISSSSLDREEEEALLASAKIRSSSFDSLSGGGVTWRDPVPSLQQQEMGSTAEVFSKHSLQSIKCQ